MHTYTSDQALEDHCLGFLNLRSAEALRCSFTAFRLESYYAGKCDKKSTFTARHEDCTDELRVIANES